MAIAPNCFDNFDDADLERGARYYQTNAVSLVNSTASSATFDVRGSRPTPYRVELDWSCLDRNWLVVSCTCPRYGDVEECKHIVAAILAADHQGLTPTLRRHRRIEVIPSEPLDEMEDDGQGSGNEVPARPVSRSSPEPTRAVVRNNPHWESLLQEAAGTSSSRSARSLDDRRPLPYQIWYLTDITQTRSDGHLVVRFFRRPVEKNGALGRPVTFSVTQQTLDLAGTEADRELLHLLLSIGGIDDRTRSYTRYTPEPTYSMGHVPAPVYDVVLPRLCATGRFGWTDSAAIDGTEVHPLAWDEGPPWHLYLRLQENPPSGYTLIGELTRGEERTPLTVPVLLLSQGLVFFRDHIARLDCRSHFGWVRVLRRERELTIPRDEVAAFLQRLWQAPELPGIDLPPELRWEEIQGEPRPRITLDQPRGVTRSLYAKISFAYDNQICPASLPGERLVDAEKHRVILRDKARERDFAASLPDLGFNPVTHLGPQSYSLELPVSAFSPAVAELLARGWHVEAEGRPIRRPAAFRLSVTSGKDWFDLEAECDFEGQVTALPVLLKALRAEERFVRLGDGTYGLLPEEWLSRYAPAWGLAEVDGTKIRFASCQAALLDALLATQAEVRVDEVFARARRKLAGLAGVQPQSEPASFRGELRPYQREGLGWLDFLRDFKFGGCLADDMGLGKTIQVLALLESRRRAKAAHRPSLVVVPRSLVHNWIQEASRFTPELRVLDYSGLDRDSLRDQFASHDLIVTTYGVLRRDILQLKDHTFEYVILDEAQAIKNSASQSAKASRLLRARHRLAVTGTPVENHLGELWSLFEFLNPGMLGAARSFTEIMDKRGRNGGGELALFSRAIRPFILRRTKEQVLQELPDKTEQTLYCELGSKERRLYDELRDHYRLSLKERIATTGLARSKVHVLEALLRLRQAACHSGLLDPRLRGETSAKLETLLEQVDEVMAEGHKVLVFSQFTKFLAIVRNRLEGNAVDYEYLDGRTRDRQPRIDRFQQDPACKLFLISLKAGGLGLNLTAADYVFILDPWWNPAVEAQAIDRTHRIGQTRKVFAYRLIARDTVEEKILDLQGEKRELVRAVVGADQSFLKNLTAEDLELLLM
ncbi:MAG: DEAD/DEAH box helicase [Planctomycetota bacterium]